LEAYYDVRLARG
jgi:hypothetical protein